MKLKVIPEDFVVEEHITLPVVRDGPYTLLKIEKRYWNTLDVIAALARKLKVSQRRFGRGGLKDRYSLATQYLTFRGKLRTPVEEKNYRVTPLGATRTPLSPKSVAANAFSITLRDLNQDEIATIGRNAVSIQKYHLPNYFDEQRFGSARHRQGFFAKALLQNHCNGALKLLLCYPTKEDNRQEREFKRFCAEHWGDWRQCQTRAPQPYRRLLYFLSVHPRATREAIKIIDRELLNLYLLAYQSHLFNRTASAIIQEYGSGLIPLTYTTGTFFFYRKIINREKLAALTLPMFTAKTSLSGEYAPFMKQVLTDEGISLKDFALRRMRFRGVRFKPFFRSLLLAPLDLKIEEPMDDDLYPGKKRMTLRFLLPPGSYATLVIKRLLL